LGLRFGAVLEIEGGQWQAVNAEDFELVGECGEQRRVQDSEQVIEEACDVGWGVGKALLDARRFLQLQGGDCCSRIAASFSNGRFGS